MRKLILIMITLLSTPNLVNAQQQPQFTHYMFNTVAVNPAYAGSRGSLYVVAVNRNQWVGIDDAPRTTTISANTPLRINKMGLGLSIVRDQTGFQNHTSFYVDYSYTVKMKEEHYFSFGVKAGFSQYKIDQEFYDFESVMEDPALNEKLNRWTPNVGAGVYYHTKKWYLGLSTPRLISTDYNKNGDFVALEKNHYYAIGGYVFGLTSNTKFKPSFSADKNWQMKGFVDSDWEGDKNNRKSVTGWMIFVSECLISWGSIGQRMVTMSSSEAEYVGISEISKAIIYIRSMF